MICAHCRAPVSVAHSEFPPDSDTPWVWCSMCGSLQRQGDPKSLHVPYRSEKKSTNPGLLSVASDAVKRASDRVARAGLGDCGKNTEDLAEAVAAVIAELMARDDDRKQITPLKRVIEDGVLAVRLERERCAAIVDAHNMGGGTALDTLLTGIARDIRTPS